MSRFVVFLVLLAMVAIIDANSNEHHGSHTHDRNNDDSDCDDSSSDSSSSDSSSSDNSSDNRKHHGGSKNHKCQKYEYWAQCGRQCEPTCNNKSPNHHSCQQSQCTAGCRCQQGYVRNNGHCMKSTDCKSSNKW
ncbi:uncharacterized protein LOC143146212 [Ptiloglossa arizonensis]|uniref:uncharacterized protein LOC143146212 n=1 Tax=Ptiloglossa arizonensis TaxID=3350558 RepID=UPI003FA08711